MKKIVFALVILLYACNSNTDKKGSRITEDIEVKSISTLDSLSLEITENSSNSKSYYNRALYFYDEAEYEQALNDISRALEVDSSIADYFLVRGNIYYDQQRFKEAFTSYQKTVEIDDEHEIAILKLCQIELILKNYDLAIEMVNKALRINQMNPTSYYLKGFIYLDAGDTAIAVSSFQTAIEVDPKHYDSYIMLGKIWAEVKPEFSETYYDQALELEPESVEALYNKGVLLQNQDRYSESYQIYDRIISIDSSAYFAYYNKGYVLLVSDSSYTEAIQYFERSLLYYPYYHQAYYNIGLCYENLGEFELSEKNYKKSLEIDPQFDPAAKGLSRILE